MQAVAHAQPGYTRGLCKRGWKICTPLPPSEGGSSPSSPPAVLRWPKGSGPGYCTRIQARQTKQRETPGKTEH